MKSAGIDRIENVLSVEGSLSTDELATLTRISSEQLTSLLEGMYAQSKVGIKNGKWRLLSKTSFGAELKQLREEALIAINEAHSTLQKANKFGINTKSEEERLNNAKLKLDEKDFSNATKFANECKNHSCVFG